MLKNEPIGHFLPFRAKTLFTKEASFILRNINNPSGVNFPENHIAESNYNGVCTRPFLTSEFALTWAVEKAETMDRGLSVSQPHLLLPSRNVRCKFPPFTTRVLLITSCTRSVLYRMQLVNELYFSCNKAHWFKKPKFVLTKLFTNIVRLNVSKCGARANFAKWLFWLAVRWRSSHK